MFSPQKLYRNNKTRNYQILVCIDVKSKYVYAAVIKDKRAETVAKEFEKILKKIKVVQKSNPSNIHLLRIFSDAGSEFKNRIFKNLLEKYNATHTIMYGPNKCFHIERFIRSLSNLLAAQYFTFRNFNLFKQLDPTINLYNNKSNLDNGISPTERIYSTKPPKYIKYFKNINFKAELQSMRKMISKYSRLYPPGAAVRIETEKRTFSKSSTNESFSNEIFYIDSIKWPILSRFQPRFRLRDKRGERILGLFNISEIKIISRK